MYFMVTREIVHPETQEPVVRRMTMLTPENVSMLVDQYGIDNMHGVLCADMRAVEAVTREMMDRKF